MSNNLNFTLMLENQSNKHITHNTAVGRVDSALTASLTLPVTNTNAATLSSLNHSANFTFDVTNSGATGPVTITLATPLPRGLFRVLNSVGQLLTIAIAGQALAAPQIIPGEMAILHSDGANVTLVQRSGAEIGGFFPGLPAASATVLRYVVARPFSLPVGLPLSRGYVEVAATVATAVFDLRKNNVSIGSMTCVVGNQIATFTLASTTTFVAGDRFSIVAPNPANATLADISFNFVSLTG